MSSAHDPSNDIASSAVQGKMSESGMGGPGSPPERFAAARALVIAIDGDEIAQPRFHAAAIASALPSRRLAGMISVPGHHFAFIAPFAERVTDKEYIPVAVDPEGFDRAAFIRDVNARLVRFFRRIN